MSQMNPGAPQNSAFARPPQNPYTQRVQERLNQQAAPAPQPVATPPAPETPLVPPAPAYRTPISPVQQAPAAPPVTPAPAYVPPAQAAPVEPSYSSADMQRVVDDAKRFQAERDALRAQLAQDQQELDEYHLLKQQAAIQNDISKEAFENLQSVDAEDAELISRAAANATAKSIAQLRQEMADQRKAFAAANQRQADTQRQYHFQQMNREILAVHPDFYELQNRPDYQQFMNQRDGLSVKTRDQRAAEEYTVGNTAFVIDLLNQYKGQHPSPQQVASVAPVQFAGSAPTQTVSQPSAPQHTLRELNTLYQMRRISHEQYRDELNKLRAAHSF